MSEIIAVKIDVMKIEKARLFAGKKGEKYLDLILIPSPQNQWGNSHMVLQGVTKEEREAGKKGPILGNAKTIGGGGSRPTQAPVNKPAPKPEQTEDVPF